MEMKDQNSEFRSPEVMRPDSTVQPPIPELSELVPGATATLPPGKHETALQREEKSRTPLQESLRRLQRDKRAMVSLGIIVFFIVLAIIGPPIYHRIGGPYQSALNGTVGPDQYHNFSHEEVDRQDELPSGQYWLGTDDLGRDILARLTQGVLISITVAVLVEVIDIILGVIIGVLAGYYGGWIDQVLARFTDIMFAFPGLLFLILVSGILGAWADRTLGKIPVLGANGNARLMLVGVALAFTIWPLMARYVRGQTLQLKEQQFVEAARTSGTSDLRIILRHIVPNLFSIVVIAATLDISNTIIAEAGISYLGLGVHPPGSSIGLMISDAAGSLRTFPWELIVPLVTLILIVLSFSFLGDGIRDAFDPRSKD
jgi:ABC-type dipeptide/oligopeptide/nickel transport system permease subunit